MESVIPILEHAPSAIELIDRTIISRCRESLGFRHLLNFVEGDPGCVLLVEFYGETNSELEDKLSKLANDLLHQRLGYAAPWTTAPLCSLITLTSVLKALTHSGIIESLIWYILNSRTLVSLDGSIFT